MTMEPQTSEHHPQQLEEGQSDDPTDPSNDPERFEDEPEQDFNHYDNNPSIPVYFQGTTKKKSCIAIMTICLMCTLVGIILFLSKSTTTSSPPLPFKANTPNQDDEQILEESSSSPCPEDSSTEITVGCGEGFIPLQIEVRTDGYPEETSWIITKQETTENESSSSSSSVLLAEGGPYGKEEASRMFIREICVHADDSCFLFQIYDSYGDGLCCGNGAGSYTLFWNGTQVAYGDEFGSLETVQIGGDACQDQTELSSSSLSILQTPLLWNQMGAGLVGDTSAILFGSDVVLSNDGNTMAVAAKHNQVNGIGSGSVYVYRYIHNNEQESSTGDWRQLGQSIHGEASGDSVSSSSISLSDNGRVLAIGAPNNDGNGRGAGHVRIFQLESEEKGNGDPEATESWKQMGSDIDGESSHDQSGTSVDLSGDGQIVAIGAHMNADNGGAAGHVKVLQYDDVNDNWVQLGDDIDGEKSGDQSGGAGTVRLSQNGNILAIGARYNSGSGLEMSGHVRVFRYNHWSGIWMQLGDDIDGKEAKEQSGYAIDLSSDGAVLAVASVNIGKYGSDDGHQVRMYKYNEQSDEWNQRGEDIQGDAGDPRNGISVSLNSNGSVAALDIGNRGQVRVYEYSSDETLWMQVGRVPGDAKQGTVSISGDGKIVAVGCAFDGENGFRAGKVSVFRID